jgi:hypothetical protein
MSKTKSFYWDYIQEGAYLDKPLKPSKTTLEGTVAKKSYQGSQEVKQRLLQRYKASKVNA